MAAGEGITQFLQEWSERSPGALDQLMPLVVDELRLLARSHFRRELAGHTLQPTAIINELYLRLLNQHSIRLADRTEFFAFSSRIIRRILVDHYRKKQKIKRGGGAPHVTLDEALGPSVTQSVDLLALDQALGDLKTLDPRQHQVVELRFFGGLTNGQIAETLDVSEATVKRDWNLARAWLLRRMES
jgi:RNA polymerase sigma factor (TIGR02999 family)